MGLLLDKDGNPIKSLDWSTGLPADEVCILQIFNTSHCNGCRTRCIVGLACSAWLQACQPQILHGLQSKLGLASLALGRPKKSLLGIF
jgi:hypothetical protein